MEECLEALNILLCKQAVKPLIIFQTARIICSANRPKQTAAVVSSDGLLYDEKLKGMSAESVYDLILSDMRRYKKMNTFHGNGHGDIISSGKNPSVSHRNTNAVNLDDFCREALQQGLEFHQSHNRGFLPAGLIEEIRALSMPAIP